jgi:hypothetical protein
MCQRDRRAPHARFRQRRELPSSEHYLASRLRLREVILALNRYAQGTRGVNLLWGYHGCLRIR